MKNFMISLLCLVSITACAQSSEFNLSVTVPEGDDSKMYYIVWENGVDKEQRDSFVVSDGKAEWSVNIGQPALAGVYNKPSKKSAQRAFQIFIVPGEECNITTEGRAYHLNGSKFYQQFDAADRFAEQLDGDDAEAKVLEYLRQHATEDGVVALTNYIDTEQFLANAKVSDRFVKLLNGILAKQKEAEAERYAEVNAMQGKPAPDFTLEDLNGKPLALSSLRGKYVVLDFWGSWCVWCIKGMPKMKEYYAKYGEKMQILGVDCGDTKDKWKACVKENSIPWLHVYNPKGSGLEQKYAIQGYPTKVVIDPQGNIIKIIIGEDPAFYKYLDDLFNGKL